MPYINGDGTVTEQRTFLRISIISDMFWAVANGVSLFFQTLFNPTAPLPKSASSTSSNRTTGGSGGPGGERRGPNIRTLPKQCTTNR
ncbi:SelK/SelG family selenoprotein [archaeon]|nr:MAG: SelK/SelG family selenoprotein [archaeon]